MSYTKWTQERVRQLRELNDKGLSNADIARTLNLSVLRIKQVKTRFRIRQPKKWTDENNQLLRELNDKGLTNAEMGKVFGLSATQIKYIKQRLGINHINQKWSTKDIQLLRKLSEQGLNNVCIAEFFGLSEATIRAAKTRYEIRSTKKWVTDEILKVQKLREEGYSYTEIADIMNVSICSVRNLVERSDLIPTQNPFFVDYKKLNRYQIQRLFSVTRYHIDKWVELGLLKASRYQKKLFIDIADFYEFVIEFRDNPDFSELQKIDLVKLKELVDYSGGLQ